MNPELSSEQASDLRYLDPKVPLSGNFSHLNWANTLSQLFNKPGLRVLEIGSREVTGPSKARKQLFAQATYVGMDVQAGPNVDIVGDAHRLSSYFDEAEPFDLIYSSAVFEHLAMPWVVAGEIAKLLKVGGCVFVETHFSFTSHERPWHFFQFSDQALKVLFSPALGYRCVEAGMDNPMKGTFTSLSAPYLRGQVVGGLYCHSQYFGMKERSVALPTWPEVDLEALTGGPTQALKRVALTDDKFRRMLDVIHLGDLYSEG